jgi:tetratricopeptide (TPR) repeat protein
MSGLCEYRLRRYDAALDSLRHAQNLGFQEAPDLSRAARLHWALLLTKTGYFENAIVVLTELTRFDRKSSEIIVAAGIAGLRQPWLPFEVPEASRNLVLKLGDAMSAVPALVGLTMIYIKREELQTALEYSERAVKAGPGDFASHES